MLSTGKTGGYEIVHQTAYRGKKKQDRDLKMPFFFKVSTHLKRNRSFTLKDDYGGKWSAVSVSLWIFSGPYINPCWRKNPLPEAAVCQQPGTLNASTEEIPNKVLYNAASFFTLPRLPPLELVTVERKYTHGALWRIIHSGKKGGQSGRCVSKARIQALFCSCSLILSGRKLSAVSVFWGKLKRLSAFVMSACLVVTEWMTGALFGWRHFASDACQGFSRTNKLKSFQRLFTLNQGIVMLQCGQRYVDTQTVAHITPSKTANCVKCVY